jgi:hypothetical protein
LGESGRLDIGDAFGQSDALHAFAVRKHPLPERGHAIRQGHLFQPQTIVECKIAHADQSTRHVGGEEVFAVGKGIGTNRGHALRNRDAVKVRALHKGAIADARHPRLDRDAGDCILMRIPRRAVV